MELLAQNLFYSLYLNSAVGGVVNLSTSKSWEQAGTLCN